MMSKMLALAAVALTAGAPVKNLDESLEKPHQALVATSNKPAVWLGQRTRGATSLQWLDIDTRSKTIVPQQEQQQQLFEPTKSDTLSSLVAFPKFSNPTDVASEDTMTMQPTEALELEDHEAGLRKRLLEEGTCSNSAGAQLGIYVRAMGG